MAKKVTAYIKLQVGAGNANPAPPVGPALGQHGVNIMEFCKAFNAKTANMEKVYLYQLSSPYIRISHLHSYQRQPQLLS